MAHLQILPGTGNRGPHSKERYFLEIRNRNKWLLETGGEKVLLYKRKFEGERCSQYDNVYKTSQKHEQDLICFGTGFTGGYFKPIEIFASLVEGAPEQITLDEFGRVRTVTRRSWTLWEPLITNGDFIVRRNGQRLWIQDVTQHRWKHFVTHQKFTMTEVERNHPIYKLP